MALENKSPHSIEPNTKTSYSSILKGKKAKDSKFYLLFLRVLSNQTGVIQSNLTLKQVLHFIWGLKREKKIKLYVFS